MMAPTVLSYYQLMFSQNTHSKFVRRVPLDKILTGLRLNSCLQNQLSASSLTALHTHSHMYFRQLHNQILSVLMPINCLWKMAASTDHASSISAIKLAAIFLKIWPLIESFLTVRACSYFFLQNNIYLHRYILWQGSQFYLHIW